MDYKLVLDALLRNPSFWATLIALGNAVLLFLVPTFPKEILAPLDTLIAIIAGAFTGAQVVTTVRRVMIARRLRQV